MSRRSDPGWTDFNQSDPGITLVELFTFLAEALDYLQDAAAEQERKRQRERYLLIAGTLVALAWCCRRRAATDR